MKLLDKDRVIDKLERLINKEVTIAGKISHSSNHLDSYTGMKAVLRNYNIGEDYEDVIALVDVVLVTGRKVEMRRTESIWMDARDLLEVGNR